MEKINMCNRRADGSKLYSGRPLGIDVRKDLELDAKDKDKGVYVFVFPEDTISINSSYFGGLFETSIMNLGREKFLAKYKFQYANGKELKDTLQRNINEGIEDSLSDF